MAKKRKPNPAAQELGRLGGKARARKLTAEQRSESAHRAVLARIAKYQQQRHKPKRRVKKDEQEQR